jgi:hypothetical protein
VLEALVVHDGDGPARHVSTELLPARDLARAPLLARGLALQVRVAAAAAAEAAAAAAEAACRAAAQQGR